MKCVLCEKQATNVGYCADHILNYTYNNAKCTFCDSVPYKFGMCCTHLCEKYEVEIGEKKYGSWFEYYACMNRDKSMEAAFKDIETNLNILDERKFRQYMNYNDVWSKSSKYDLKIPENIVNKDEDSNNNDDNDENRCVVCYKSLKGNINITLSCGHIFHYKCMCEYQIECEISKCPLCRMEYKLLDLDKIDAIRNYQTRLRRLQSG